MFFFKSSTLANYEKIFYDFNIESISGEMINFNKYKGKAVLVVNTASYCGFTKQYDELQSLWDNYKSRGLIVLGIPSNSFNQENSSNSELNLIHQGISSRGFERRFTLSDEVQVNEAELKDGMLRIQLKKIIPEHKKPKLIKIN